MPEIRKKITPFLKLFQKVYYGVIIVFIIVLIFRYWGQIKNIDWDFRPEYLILSIMIVIGALISWAFVWTWLVKVISQSNLTYYEGLNIYLYGNLAKYLPGSVWNFFARGYLGDKAGIHVINTGLASILEISGSLVIGILLYSISRYFSPFQNSIFPRWVLFFIAIISAGLTSPPILKKIIKVFKPKESVSLGDFNWKNYTIYLSVTFIIWLFVGTGFYFLIQSVKPITLQSFIDIVGIWSFAAVISLLAIGIPQGIGVKEGVLVSSLNYYFPISVSITIAGLSRLWLVACEITATLIWWVLTTRILKIPLKNY